jgi:hypothetical protein
MYLNESLCVYLKMISFEFFSMSCVLVRPVISEICKNSRKFDLDIWIMSLRIQLRRSVVAGSCRDIYWFQASTVVKLFMLILFLCFYIVWLWAILLTFRRHMLSPSSGSGCVSWWFKYSWALKWAVCRLLSANFSYRPRGGTSSHYIPPAPHSFSKQGSILTWTHQPTHFDPEDGGIMYL